MTRRRIPTRASSRGAHERLPLGQHVTGPRRVTGSGTRSRPSAGRSSTGDRLSLSRSPRCPPTIEGERTPHPVSRSTPLSRSTSRRPGIATVVLIATDWPGDLERSARRIRPARLTGLRSSSWPTRRPRSRRPRSPRWRRCRCRDVVWTSQRLGTAVRRANIGIRRRRLRPGRDPARHEPRADRGHRDAARPSAR